MGLPRGSKKIVRDSRKNAADVFDFRSVAAATSESPSTSFKCRNLGSCLITMTT